MGDRVQADQAILAGVDRYRVAEPLFEGVRVVLSYRGETYSPAYVQGISGAAFRIAGICPCAPTCSYAMETQDLIRLLGYEVEYLPASGEGVDQEVALEVVLPRLKDEIRADRPVLLWNGFTVCEWDVVCGFREKEGQLLGRGSHTGLDRYARADEQRAVSCTAICPALGAILVGEKTGAFDRRAAEIAALHEAIRHARSRENEDLLGGDEWVMLYGLRCYDRWIGNFRATSSKVPDMGDRYCLRVYRSTRRAAAAFMRELDKAYPEADPQFRRAGEEFFAEAKALDRCYGLLFRGLELSGQADPERNAGAVALLSLARDAYAHGIERIERALRTVGA